MCFTVDWLYIKHILTLYTHYILFIWSINYTYMVSVCTYKVKLQFQPIHAKCYEYTCGLMAMIDSVWYASYSLYRSCWQYTLYTKIVMYFSCIFLLSKDLCKLQGIVYRREGSIRDYRSEIILYLLSSTRRVGGDIVDESGNGGKSIYGTTFDG